MPRPWRAASRWRPRGSAATAATSSPPVKPAGPSSPSGQTTRWSRSWYPACRAATTAASAGFVPPGFSADDAAYLADPFSRGNRHPGTDSIMRLPGEELISAGDLLVATEASAPDHRRALRQLLHREIHRLRPCHHPRRRAHRVHQRRPLAPLSGRSRRWSRRPPRGCSAGSGCGLSAAGRNAVPQVDYGGEVAGQDDGALLRCGVWRAGAGTLLHAPAMVNSARAAGAAWMLSRAGSRRPVMRHPQTCQLVCSSGRSGRPRRRAVLASLARAIHGVSRHATSAHSCPVPGAASSLSQPFTHPGPTLASRITASTRRGARAATANATPPP